MRRVSPGRAGRAACARAGPDTPGSAPGRGHACRCRPSFLGSVTSTLRTGYHHITVSVLFANPAWGQEFIACISPHPPPFVSALEVCAMNPGHFMLLAFLGMPE